MRTAPLISLLASLFVAASAALADPPKLERVIDLLQEAKASTSPISLLERAKARLKEYQAAPSSLKATVAGVGARAQAANALAARKHKQRTMELLNEAIELAKKGENPESKINAAIASAHRTGSFRR